MKALLKRLFGGPRARAPNSQSPSSMLPGAEDFPNTIEDGSENATRRQLVQVLLRDVMRRNGIPPGWIECTMLLVSSRSRGHGMYVRLVMRHWDERLMNYAFAFQQTLLKEIERFEPQASTWLHGMSWQLEVADSCPYLTMPDRNSWKGGTAVPAMAAVAPAALPSSPVAVDVQPKKPVRANDPTADLERLFAIRDRELSKQAEDGLRPVGYEQTQPSSL